MEIDVKKTVKIILNAVCFFLLMGLIIWGHKQPGLNGLLIQTLGLGGLLVQLYFYNKGK